MTRHEHLEWCKSRALEYVDAGDGVNAFASFQSDMCKHEETARTMEQPFLAMLSVHSMMAAARGDLAAVRSYIEGFN